MPRLPRVLTALVPLLAAGLVVAACSTPTSAQMPATAAGAQTRTTVTKLLVFVEENHSLDGMRAGMPYTYGLARTYGYAIGYHALAHPSLPNYIGIAGGQMYGVHDDALPPSHRLTGRSVFGQALSHGTTAAVYADSMPVRCDRSNSGDYAPKHNPWTYFAHERTVFRRDGMLLARTRHVTLLPGEKLETLSVRFRTVGDATLTGAVESFATTSEDIIVEVAASRITERGATRGDDKFNEAAMEDRKKEGYF